MTLTSRFHDVRALTERLADPLSPEDQCIQSMPDVSPTKWHRAHVTWFFETFLLKPHLEGYDEFHPSFGYLFNSYYEAVGERHPRPERGLVSRPSVRDVAEYRDYVDKSMVELLAATDAHDDLVELGLNHEQQHQELLLMDIKHVLSCNGAIRPSYQLGDRRTSPHAADPDPLRWVGFGGGEVDIGHDGPGFAFDNEGPRHGELVQPYALADRLVTCGEWLEFMAAGGYETAELWLSDGWYHIQEAGWRAPSYWYEVDGGWHVFTLAGPQPIDPAEPVCHLSYYEADAFARWAGARLPTEAEWEAAAASAPVVGNFLDCAVLHPTAAPSADGRLRQLYGDVWEWTSSPYSPYPGFAPAAGAVGEYNGKFMVNQMVLRGGCCATPPGHTRATYRNFFHPHTRWHFSGVRLAKDG